MKEITEIIVKYQTEPDKNCPCCGGTGQGHVYDLNAEFKCPCVQQKIKIEGKKLSIFLKKHNISLEDIIK